MYQFFYFFIIFFCFVDSCNNYMYKYNRSWLCPFDFTVLIGKVEQLWCLSLLLTTESDQRTSIPKHYVLILNLYLTSAILIKRDFHCNYRVYKTIKQLHQIVILFLFLLELHNCLPHLYHLNKIQIYLTHFERPLV